MAGLAAEEGVYRAESVRAIERAAIERHGIAGRELMERAGAAAWSLACARWPGARRILVLVGAGNNGGDGYVVARLAREAGREVRVQALADPARASGDALAALRAWQGVGGRVESFDPAAPETCDLVVDALLGTGLAREVDGEFARAIEALERAGAPVLAVDIPSGLHADSGAVLGRAVRAAATATFIGLKQGLVTGAGPEHCGELVLDTLGLPPELLRAVEPDARLLGEDALRRALPPRRRGAHKGDHGHVLVVGGEVGYAGAARMAGEAAARVGAGLVTVATRPEHAGLVSAARPELMARPVARAADLRPALARATVVAVGPGLGQGAWARELLAAALDSGLPLVVDADALNLLAAEPIRRHDWVLTPHPGEAGRLLGWTSAAVQADRYAAARALAARYGGTCVLKGSGTLVCHAGAIAVCTAGNPGMAAGGTGDVLTGVVAGLAAQGLALPVAAAAGVQAHGRAGDLAAAQGGERGLLATDLFAHLRGLVNPPPA